MSNFWRGKKIYIVSPVNHLKGQVNYLGIDDYFCQCASQGSLILLLPPPPGPPEGGRNQLREENSKFIRKGREKRKEKKKRKEKGEKGREKGKKGRVERKYKKKGGKRK